LKYKNIIYSYNYDQYLYPNNYNEFVTAGFRLHHTVHRDFKFLDSEFQETEVNIPGIDEDADGFEIFEMRSNNWLFFDQTSTLMISFLGESTYTAQFYMNSGMNHLLQMVSV